MQLQNVIVTKIILGTFVKIMMKIMMEFLMTQKALVILNQSSAGMANLEETRA